MKRMLLLSSALSHMNELLLLLLSSDKINVKMNVKFSLFFPTHMDDYAVPCRMFVSFFLCLGWL